MDKQNIINKIKYITKNDAIKEWTKLTNFNLNNVSNETRIGNKIIDFFTFEQRLETKSKKGYSYWDFVSSTEYQNRKYIKSLIDYQHNKGIEYYTSMYSIFKLHFSSIGLFKPIRVMKLIDFFPVENIVDPFMGWGCRAIGSAAMGINSYTGIDTNMDLVDPYIKLGTFLKELGVKTKLTFMFKDCLDVDYSLLNYDCVMTSPPYYNIEIYNGMTKKTIQEWNFFYTQIFSITYKHLLVGGYFMINILTKIYIEVLIPLLGEATFILPLGKKNRIGIEDKSNEAIFIYKKLV